jgi:uncharacterized protein (DUF1697 family)
VIRAFVVLLRGVNVGKGHRIAMADFRALLETLGFTEVKTLLNSGNAVFRGAARSAAGHAKAIDARLQESLGLAVPVVVKSSSEFLAAVAENPFAFPAANHSRFLTVFSQDPGATKGLAALRPLVEAGEQFAIGSHAAYLHCPGGILQSKVASALLGKMGRGVTTRNWATVLKLEAALGLDIG